MERESITIQAHINAPVDRVWDSWNDPEEIIRWNAASPDWHTTKASNDFRAGGLFSYRMESKDGKVGFDFEGIYQEVDFHKLIRYTITDGRRVEIRFTPEKLITKVFETFEAENIHSVELQRAGWQAILDNFKRHVESD